MDIYDISEKTGVAVRTLRKIDKCGYLKVIKSKNPIIDQMKENLRKGNRLTAIQQLHLVQNPKDVKLLARWEFEATEILAKLGNVSQEAMPWQIAHNADLAASKNKEAADKLAHWFCNFIDGNPAFANGASCDHAYLVVRMLFDVPEHHLEHLAKIAQRAMWNCRGTKRMAGYYHTDSKRRTRYHRPTKMLDL